MRKTQGEEDPRGGRLHEQYLRQLWTSGSSEGGKPPPAQSCSGNPIGWCSDDKFIADLIAWSTVFNKYGAAVAANFSESPQIWSPPPAANLESPSDDAASLAHVEFKADSEYEEYDSALETNGEARSAYFRGDGEEDRRGGRLHEQYLRQLWTSGRSNAGAFEWGQLHSLGRLFICRSDDVVRMMSAESKHAPRISRTFDGFPSIQEPHRYHIPQPTTPNSPNPHAFSEIVGPT